MASYSLQKGCYLEILKISILLIGKEDSSMKSSNLKIRTSRLEEYIQSYKKNLIRRDLFNFLFESKKWELWLQDFGWTVCIIWFAKIIIISNLLTTQIKLCLQTKLKMRER